MAIIAKQTTKDKAFYQHNSKPGLLGPLNTLRTHTKSYFTITAEISARSLANFYCQ